MLPPQGRRTGDDVTDDTLKLTKFKLKKVEEGDAGLTSGETAPLGRIDEFGPRGLSKDEKKTLSEIIEAFNARHGAEFSSRDFVRFEVAAKEIADDEDLAEMLGNNPLGTSEQRFPTEFIQRVIRI